VTATVLVTGYGGFLGRAICLELMRNGFQVRGIARNHYPTLEIQGVHCIQASATEYDACERASQGVDAIIHTAALAGVWGKTSDFVKANIDATDNLLKASRKNNIRAFVFTSSPSVTFDGSPQRNVNEQAPYPKRWLCDYPRTKAIAEQHVLEADNDQFSTCSLRPHLIWGAGDPHLIPRVIARCKSGRLRRVGNGKNRIDTVHVDFAAIAHRLALERLLSCDRRASGRSYFITDGTPIECWEWITTILKSAGLEPPNKSITLQGAYRLGHLLEIIFRVLKIRTEPPMTRFVAAQLGVDHYFDITEAKDRLNYQPIENRLAAIAALGNEKVDFTTKTR